MSFLTKLRELFAKEPHLSDPEEPMEPRSSSASRPPLASRPPSASGAPEASRPLPSSPPKPPPISGLQRPLEAPSLPVIDLEDARGASEARTELFGADHPDRIAFAYAVTQAPVKTPTPTIQDPWAH